jgi:cell division septation protein DedD
MQTSSNRSKPGSAATQPTSGMTFYKAVEQKNASPQLTPATDAVASNPTPDASTSSGASSAAQSPSQPANPPDPMVPIPAGGYFVQVAAVSKQEDAESLVDALKKKQYPAFVVSSPTTDKLFRVQLGPFGDIKEAEGVRARLVNDGYNPILKK